METMSYFYWMLCLILSKNLKTYASSASSTEWKLVWADEFDGDVIDQSMWNFEIGNGCHISNDLCGWGNKELQWYTNSTENAFIDKGHLVIQAKRDYSKENFYTSARMITKGKGDWQFGKIEVRAKFPSGKGISPVIWMLPSYDKFGIWPASGEIDIAAYFTDKEVLKTIGHVGTFYNDHHPNEGDNRAKPGHLKYSEGFHTFAVERERDKMTWFINNRVVFTYSARDELHTTKHYIYPFNERFHLVMSLSVGGNIVGVPSIHTPFPQRLEIDYVRVYVK